MSEEREHFDVLIVGAGLSGIGAACQLSTELPHKSFAVLEARDRIGGTWDLFRYPGVRSDSDMYTLGYSFHPWEEAAAIAPGAAIREYIVKTARHYGVESAIRFGHKVVSACWESAESRWTVEVQIEEAGATKTSQLSCGFLHVCTGYYRYDQGYAPALPGRDRFRGAIIHPQHWPRELQYAGKRVVVIGSGATAVTLVPTLAAEAEHVTMLQRSPSYVMSLPSRDPVADALRRWLPKQRAYAVIRWKNWLLSQASFLLSRHRPQLMRRLLRRAAQRQLPSEYAVETHFNPSYQPWDQRLCLVPDGDLFEAISSGAAEVVTDRIEALTPDGICLQSGRHLEADLIITATGLNVLLLGGMRISVDGREIDPAQTVAYKGMMLSGVPNLAMAIGYTNASWTLKCDLVSGYVCRLLRHMDERGYISCTPHPPPRSMGTEPIIDLQSGYVLRSLDALPRQGASAPWRLHQNYARDVALLRRGPLEDEGIQFASRRGRPAAPPRPAGLTARATPLVPGPTEAAGLERQIEATSGSATR